MTHRTSLEHACELITDGTHYTPTDVGVGIPFLTVKDVRERGLDFDGSAKISSADFKQADLGNSAPRAGDVLFSKDGTVGKVHVVDTDTPFAVLSSLAILRPKPGVDSQFLGHVLRSPTVVEQAMRRKTGSAIRRVILSDLKQVTFELPPLDEQRRIATILDQADALRAKRGQTLALLDDLTQSIFLDMFGDPRTWPQRWPMTTIGELAEDVQYGSSSKSGETGEWPMLRMGNVTYGGHLDLSDLKYVDLAPADVPKYTVRRGDLLFNRTNSAEKVGKSAVVETDRPLAVAGYLVRVRMKPEHSSHFVAGYLNSAHGKAVLRNMAKAIVNQANINASEMKAMSIAAPPSVEQSRFEQRLLEVDAARARWQVAELADLELFKSLQSRAFSGQLPSLPARDERPCG